MKLIIAIVQPEELPDIKEELLKRKIYKFTVSSAKGQGKEIPVQEVYRGISHEISLLTKIRLEIAVNDDYVDNAVEAITAVAKKPDNKQLFLVECDAYMLKSKEVKQLNLKKKVKKLQKTMFFC